MEESSIVGGREKEERIYLGPAMERVSTLGLDIFKCFLPYVHSQCRRGEHLF